MMGYQRLVFWLEWKRWFRF